MSSSEDRYILLKSGKNIGKRLRIGRPLGEDLLLDRVEYALLISLGEIEGSLDEIIRDSWDQAALIVIADLMRRSVLFRVEYPYVKAYIKGSWYKIYPLYVEESIEDLDGIDLIAVVDFSGDVVYYKIEETNL